jgi:enoyl-CoA hydratase/carnithine racemase
VGEHVSTSTDEHGVATLRLDRPPVNALDEQMWSELDAAARALAADARVGAVVLWGGPKVFAAGADIKAMHAMSFDAFVAHGQLIQAACSAVARIPKVVVAAINGYALGGGNELALAADFRYAAENAKLGQPEVKLGIMPGAGGTQRLTRLIGVAKAKELVLGGELCTADEARDMGLVDRVLPPGEVYDAAVEAARRYARGPAALGLAKQAIDEGAGLDLDSALRLETALFTASFATEDRRTGMASFIEHGPGQAEFRRR